jgi:hypothetical protein
LQLTTDNTKLATSMSKSDESSFPNGFDRFERTVRPCEVEAGNGLSLLADVPSITRVATDP